MLNEHTHPNLVELIRLIANDNGLAMKDNLIGPYSKEYMALLEEQAGKLNPFQQETFVTGPRIGSRNLIQKYDIYALSEFLNEAFDGKFSCCFYE